MIKTFIFNIDEEYKEVVVGKGSYSTSGSKLPSFVGKTESSAKSLAKSLGLSVTIKYIDSTKGTNGTVLYQNYSSGTNLLNVNNLVLTVVKHDSSNDDTSNDTNDNKSDDTNNSTDTTDNKKDSVDLEDITGIDGIE